MLDTGSSAVVVSENFCKKNGITIPFCKYSREVTVVDEAKVIMREW